jgi:hypothetical protein
MATIHTLPHAVVTQIFNCLMWTEKLDIVNAIPELEIVCLVFRLGAT